VATSSSGKAEQWGKAGKGGERVREREIERVGGGGATCSHTSLRSVTKLRLTRTERRGAACIRSAGIPRSRTETKRREGRRMRRGQAQQRRRARNVPGTRRPERREDDNDGNDDVEDFHLGILVGEWKTNAGSNG
jgi:hypothetical protein